MTNMEAVAELTLGPGHAGTPQVQVLAPRAVPLGGPRAMTVRRTLPHRERSFVGAWCFVDHYGPDDVARTGGMKVPPHPHTGLQTLSWLFSGTIEHRDSGGVHAIVKPGEVNLMTAGHGIAHSEVTTPTTTQLHGVQLWIALPTADRDAPRNFQHHRPEPVELARGVHARILVGDLAGAGSPVHSFTPLVGAQLDLAAGATCTLPVDASDEHGLLVDMGAVRFGGMPLARGQLGILDSGRREVTLHATRATRALLLGGAPFEERIVMWWNFVARTHEEIAHARQQWQERADRFGVVEGYAGSRLDAPPLPSVRLKARGRAGRGVL
jgi:hypothetical protein